MPRRPTPTHLKVVKGTQRKDRTNPSEPAPKKTTPLCPAHLSDEAKVQWGRFSVLLERMGVLTEVDGSALEQLCLLYLECTRLQSLIDLHGDLIEVTTTQKEKVLKPNPASAMLKAAQLALHRYQIEFGMTPSARTKVHTVGSNVHEEEPVKPAESYF